MSNIYAAENTVAREDLAALINGLTDAQLSQPMDAGWTVAAVLAHLAFWDQRGLVLLRQWQREGIAPSPIDTHVINEASRVLCLAIPARAAVELALACAKAIDDEIDGLDIPFLTEVEIGGTTVLLNRGRHRRTHMAEITQALGLAE